VTSLVLGIDPDAFGALAFVDRETGVLVDVLDMPQLDLKPARLVDVQQVASILDEWSERIGFAFIEKAWARPTDPPSYAFRIGHNYGSLVGVVAAHFIKIRFASPQAWKKAVGCTADKDTSRARASAMFPAECARWRFKKHHGRAEAVLIAAYGRGELLRKAAA
jgi:crossover junction endodeoxyribonuclease RuvC